MKNLVILIGNLGKDPEVRFTQSGQANCNASLATTRTWKDKQGEKKSETEWHRLVLFGKQAEIFGEYLKKGSRVYIEGRIKTRSYQVDGQDRYTTEIIVDNFQMLDSRNQDGAANSGDSSSNNDFDDADVPF